MDLLYNLVSYEATLACKKCMTIVLGPCSGNGNKYMPCFFVFITIVLWPCGVNGKKQEAYNPIDFCSKT